MDDTRVEHIIEAISKRDNKLIDAMSKRDESLVRELKSGFSEIARATDVRNDVTYLRTTIDFMKQTIIEIKQDGVKRNEFTPIRLLGYGAVGLVMMTVGGALLAGIIGAVVQ